MNTLDLAPIVLFVYNRPWHTEQTLNALMNNELAAESTLYIFADGPKKHASAEQLNKTTEVRQIIRSRQWCKEVIIVESEENKGLANSVINGVTEVIDKYNKVIVLEDDLVTSKFFLRFMNESLYFYNHDTRIFSIGGYNYNINMPESYKYDIFLAHRAESWGWATWKDRWLKVDWDIKDFEDFILNKKEVANFNKSGNDLSNMLKLQMEGKIDSWAIRWDYAHFKNNTFCIRPTYALVNNIGLDGSGIHCSNSGNDNKFLDSNYCIQLSDKVEPNSKVQKNLKKYFDNTSSIRYKIKRILKSYKKFRFKWFIITLFTIKPVSNIFGLDRGTPIDRLYIEHFLKTHNVDIKGKVLEIAESTYTKKFGINVDDSQVLHFDKSNNQATIVGDLSAPHDLPEGIVDCFICTQTLNFIYDVKSAIVGCHKLLTDGGVFLGTVAGLSQISRYDMDRWGDYWRFTDLSIRKMFEEVFGEGHVEIKIYGNALAATAFIQGLAVEDILSVKKLMQEDNNFQLIIGIRAVK